MNSETENICTILKKSRSIAVYGISSNSSRISRQIASFLKSNGYHVVGVNPSIDLAGDIVVYPNLKAIPHHIDIVNVFRRSEEIPELINDTLQIKPNVLWLQEGIRNDEAVKPIVEKGITVIQDKCIAVLYNHCKAIGS
jgi:predicted CoA-binding protein